MLRLPAALEVPLRLIGSGFGFGERLIAVLGITYSSSAISRRLETHNGADQAKRTK